VTRRGEARLFFVRNLPRRQIVAEPIKPLPLLTTVQIAERYGLRPAQVVRMIRVGINVRFKLRALKVGGHWKLTLEAADEFFRQLKDHQL
jgi:hypothetical protein